MVDIFKVKRILKGTMDLSLKIEGKGENLECYVDSSLGADSDGGSTCGCLILLFGERHIALSSAEAEYISMSWACKEVASMRELLIRLLRISVVPVIYEDNITSICWSSSEESVNLKHVVNLCYHFIRLEAANGNVNIVGANFRPISRCSHKGIRTTEIFNICSKGVVSS